MIKQNGFALVLVLWVLSLLTLMAGSFTLTMRRETSIVSGISKQAQASAIAESGLAIAELMLLHPDQLLRWRSDGSIYQIDYPDSQIRVRLLSESGKVDINSADETLLQELLAYAPVDTEQKIDLANAIIDWRDADDLVRLNGAESKEYKNAGLSYRPRNQPFQSIEELQMVLGMNQRTYHWLENLVTVHSGSPKVDFSQAPIEVLQVLSKMNGELLYEFIAARRVSALNGLPAPRFTGGEEGFSVNEQSNETQPTSGRPKNIFEIAAEKAAQKKAAQKEVTMIISEALLDDGTSATVQALIKPSDSKKKPPFEILKWQNGGNGDDSLFTVEKEDLLIRHYAEPQFNY